MDMADFRLPPITLTGITTDTSEIPWGVQMINAPNVWEKSTGSNVVVAILDTGIDTEHPDLAGRVIGGRNFTSDYNANPNIFKDNQGHGTHCAGTIAAIGNQKGVVGVAPDVKLLIGKILDSSGAGGYQNIINGIRWAADWKGVQGETVRVISMSLGGPQDYPPLHEAIKYAVSKGISVVVAAGNEGDNSTSSSEFSYPGAYSEVIEVGAINSIKSLASFSNTNDEIDVVAPGVDILSTIPGGSYAKMSGTSMATPHVAGALALLIGMNETNGKRLTENEIYQLLIKNTANLNIDKRGEGNGLVFLQVIDNGVQEPAKPNPVVEPKPVPSDTKREYDIYLRRIGKRYAVEVGSVVDYGQAYKLANQLKTDLNSINNVNAKF